MRPISGQGRRRGRQGKRFLLTAAVCALLPAPAWAAPDAVSSALALQSGNVIVLSALACGGVALAIAAGLWAKVKEQLPGNMPVALYDGTPENPTEAAMRDALALYKEEGCDGIIAIGGGSPMDLAKGVALMATHPGPSLQAEGPGFSASQVMSGR